MDTATYETRWAFAHRWGSCGLVALCLMACDCAAPPKHYDVIERADGGPISGARGVAGRMLLRISAANWADAEHEGRTPFDIRQIESLEISMDGDLWGTYPVSAGAGDERVALVRIEPGRELEATDTPPATLGEWAQLLSNGAESGAHILRIDAAQIRHGDGSVRRHGVAEAYIDFEVVVTEQPMDLGKIEFVVTEEVAA